MTTVPPPAAASDGSATARPPRAVPVGILAALLHLGIGVFPLSASGLLAPLWAIVLIGVGWLVAAVALWRIWRRRPLIALLVPPSTVGVWAAFITLGERVLGWTA